jgi:hypothetical protein
MRYLIAIVVCGIMLAGLRSLTTAYKEERQRVEDAARAEADALAAEERALAEEDELASQSAGAGDGYDGPDRRGNR